MLWGLNQKDTYFFSVYSLKKQKQKKSWIAPKMLNLQNILKKTWTEWEDLL